MSAFGFVCLQICNRSRQGRSPCSSDSQLCNDNPALYTIEFTLNNDISFFTAAVRATLLAAFATQLGVPARYISITYVAASLKVTVNILVPPGKAVPEVDAYVRENFDGP